MSDKKDNEAIAKAWAVLLEKLGTKGWTVSDKFNFNGFFAWGWDARSQYDSTHITELQAQLADAKQVANDCRIVADNAIAEAKNNQWQVIETTPKEGSEVIVYTPPLNGEDEQYTFEKYEDECFIAHSNNYEHFCMVAKGGSDCAWIGPSEKPKYTHWMPMPAAPAIAEGEQV